MPPLGAVVITKNNQKNESTYFKNHLSGYRNPEHFGPDSCGHHQRNYSLRLIARNSKNPRKMELTIYDVIELPKTDRRAMWAAVKDMKEAGKWITNHKALNHELINL